MELTAFNSTSFHGATQCNTLAILRSEAATEDWLAEVAEALNVLQLEQHHGWEMKVHSRKISATRRVPVYLSESTEDRFFGGSGTTGNSALADPFQLLWTWCCWVLLPH